MWRIWTKSNFCSIRFLLLELNIFDFPCSFVCVSLQTGEWTCLSCTFENGSANDICGMCFAPKNAVGNEEVGFQAQNLAEERSSTSTKQSAPPVGEASFEVQVFEEDRDTTSIEESPPLITFSERKNWACPICTFENDMQQSACQLCSTTRPMEYTDSGFCGKEKSPKSFEIASSRKPIDQLGSSIQLLELKISARSQYVVLSNDSVHLLSCCPNFFRTSGLDPTYRYHCRHLFLGAWCSILLNYSTLAWLCATTE